MKALDGLWRWRQGRQGTGYEKLLLATAPWPVPFDLYLLRFREGIEVPWHVDQSKPGQRHYRLNVTLRPALAGGRFETKDGRPIVSLGWLALFRPDRVTHAQTRIDRGTQLMLSLGWLWPEPRARRPGHTSA